MAATCHLQSFFIYTSMPVLERVFPNGLCDPKAAHDQSKDALVTQGEIGLSQKVLAAGFGLRSASFRTSTSRRAFPGRFQRVTCASPTEYERSANLC